MYIKFTFLSRYKKPGTFVTLKIRNEKFKTYLYWTKKKIDVCIRRSYVVWFSYLEIPY